MLALKLLLVPGFLLFVSLVGARFGPAVAGATAALPVVTGPILLVLALEQGPRFAAAAAAAAASATLASLAFGVLYAHAARRTGWPGALLLGLAGWAAAAVLLTRLPSGPAAATCTAALVMLAAPHLYPRVRQVRPGRPSTVATIALRMAAGAALTLTVTLAAGHLGSTASGIAAVFPVMASVLAVSCHRTQGWRASGALMRGMARGMNAFAAFCIALALALPRAGIPAGFGLALCAALAVQGALLAGWGRRAHKG